MSNLKRSVLFLFMLSGFISYAQENDSTAVEQALTQESSDSAKTTIVEIPMLPYSESKHTIAVNFGIQGAGLAYAYNIRLELGDFCNDL